MIEGNILLIYNASVYYVICTEVYKNAMFFFDSNYTKWYDQFNLYTLFQLGLNEVLMFSIVVLLSSIAIYGEKEYSAMPVRRKIC